MKPLAQSDALKHSIKYGAKVLSVVRVKSDNRQIGEDRHAAYELVLESGEQISAGAVIDASGTWYNPNPAGAHGRPAENEMRHSAQIAYGTPAIDNAAPGKYADKTSIVVGAGHSAMTNLVRLLDLLPKSPHTKIYWALRKDRSEGPFGGGEQDELPARGRLGLKIKAAIESQSLEVISPFLIDQIEKSDGKLAVKGRRRSAPYQVLVDQMIVATGFRPNLSMLRGLRLDLTPPLKPPQNWLL